MKQFITEIVKKVFNVEAQNFKKSYLQIKPIFLMAYVKHGDMYK